MEVRKWTVERTNSRSLALELQVPVSYLVLATKPRLSGRVASALNSGAFSPALLRILKAVIHNLDRP